MDVCVTGAGPLRTAKGGDTLTENTTTTMNMDKNEEKPYQPQRGRIPQGSAQDSGIVPAGPASSSDDGQATSGETPKKMEGVELHIPTVESAATSGENVSDSVSDFPEALIKEVEGDLYLSSEDEAFEKESSPPILPYVNRPVEEKEDIESASMVSGGTAMEWDEARASKRKMPHSKERRSSSESEDEILRRAKVSRKQKILGEDKSHKDQSKSNPDLHSRPSEEDPNIMKMKKGYISKLKRLEIEEAKEEIAEKKREELRKKKEEKNKAEEEKRKKEERAKAEANVMAKISTKANKEEEKDYINNMTASDLAAMALEYLDHVETIRSKCRTMQGALSGELKRRKLSLDNMVRALHYKAEEKGDPQFLKSKIDELINKNREEEVRRTREISELRETVASLTKENKEMRRELRSLKEDIDRKKNIEKKEKKERYLPARLEKKEEDIICEDPTTPLQRTIQRCPSLVSMEEGPVMRPPLKGKSTPIPNSDLKQKEKISKGGIKVISNIQVKPPREKEVQKEVDKEDCMEWEETGFDWNEEVEKEEKEKNVLIEEDIHGKVRKNIQDRKKAQEGSYRKKEVQEGSYRKKEEGAWALVTKKGRKENKPKKKEEGEIEEKTTSANNNRQKMNKELKRKPPKTAAVSIKGDVSKGFSYADALRKARTQIKMEDLQIAAPRIRKALNGATIIEISGLECHDKAQKLAEKLQEVLREDNVAISTPFIKGELRLTGLDESISQEEISWAIAEEGCCKKENIRIGDIKRSKSGMGVTWVKCPLKAAVDIAKKRKIKIGWTIVGVTLLSARPLQCFRCWHLGHVKDTCRSKIDRSKKCYQCGKEGHKAAACENAVNCAVCVSQGYESNHRVASPNCEGIKSRLRQEMAEKNKAQV